MLDTDISWEGNTMRSQVEAIFETHMSTTPEARRSPTGSKGLGHKGAPPRSGGRRCSSWHHRGPDTDRNASQLLTAWRDSTKPFFSPSSVISAQNSQCSAQCAFALSVLTLKYPECCTCLSRVSNHRRGTHTLHVSAGAKQSHIQ